MRPAHTKTKERQSPGSRQNTQDSRQYRDSTHKDLDQNPTSPTVNQSKMRFRAGNAYSSVTQAFQKKNWERETIGRTLLMIGVRWGPGHIHPCRSLCLIATRTEPFLPSAINNPAPELTRGESHLLTPCIGSAHLSTNQWWSATLRCVTVISRAETAVRQDSDRRDCTPYVKATLFNLVGLQTSLYFAQKRESRQSNGHCESRSVIGTEGTRHPGALICKPAVDCSLKRIDGGTVARDCHEA